MIDGQAEDIDRAPRRIAQALRSALASRSMRRLGWTLAVASIVHPLASWLARFDWRADLFAHFREPALVVSLAAAAAMAAVRRPVAAVLGVLALWQGWGLASCSWPNPVLPDANSSARLRVLAANVLITNTDQESLIRLVRRERPDVLGLIEVSDAWLAGLEPIRSEFPYRYDYPFDDHGLGLDDDGSGLALWLRERPIAVDRVLEVAPGGMPAVHAVVDFAGKPRDLWLIHFRSPFDRPDELPPGEEFMALAASIRKDDDSTLVIGDFNSTDGSPHFGRFLDASKLRDSRLGFGRQGSWPAWSPYRIGIDHAFLTPDLAVLDRRLGPGIGSDHLPLILDVAPASIPETKGPVQASQSSSGSGSASANLTRSTSRRNATRRSTSVASNRPASLGSATISSVVFDPQPGPNAPIKAPRTTSEDAISR